MPAFSPKFEERREPTHCASCHWFGYLDDPAGYALCMNPTATPVRSTPREGCAFWRREPGVDIEFNGLPARLERDDPARARIDLERERLGRILELGAKAETKLPHGVYVVMVDRGGLLSLSIPPNAEYRGGTLGELMPILEWTGVNNAVRAGRL